MSYHPGTVWHRAIGLYEKNQDVQALALIDIGFQEAVEHKDLGAQIAYKYFERLVRNKLRQYDQALACATWVVSHSEQLEEASKDSFADVTAILARSYPDWVATALNVRSMEGESFDSFFDEASDYLRRHALQEYEIELLHARSVTLNSSHRYEDALIYAEEALARKRLDTRAPGCGLYHHLETYGEILQALNRFDDAERILNEAIEAFPEKASIWATRAALRFSLGELQEALRDYDEALFIERTANRLVRRGVVRHLLTEESPKEDLEAAIRIDKGASDAIIASHLCGVGAPGIKMLADEDSIDGLCAGFCLNNLDREELVRRTDLLTASPEKLEWYRCQAFCVVGYQALTKKLVLQSKDYLERSVATGVKQSMYYAWAFNLLARCAR